MGDIHVKVGGDGSGAKQAFHDGAEGAHELGEHIAEAVEKIHLFVEAIEKSVEKLYEFGKESVEAYFKIEKANAQLERAAGQNTEAFREQAEAMSEHLGVSNVTIETMQTMLVTFGEAPEKVEATTKALLDYSVRSGKDAVSATHELLSATQSGKTAFKELGLEYNKTGLAGQDLINITEALTKKIGGTAEEESNTLEGALKKANNQTVLFQQALGQLLAEFVADTGAVGTFTEVIKEAGQALRILTGHGRGIAEIGVELERANATLERYKTGWFYSTDDVKKQTAEVERLRAELVKAGLAHAQLGIFGEAKLSGKGTDRATGNAKGAGGHEAKSEEEKQAEHNFKVMAEWDAKDLQMELDNDNAKKESQTKYWDEVLKIQQEGQKKTMEEQEKKELDDRKFEEADDKAWDDKIKKTMKNYHALETEIDKENQKFHALMEQAGKKIGDALTSALVGALQAALDGEEFDVLGAVADVAFAAAAVAADVLISTYAENPALGQGVAAGISAIGGLAHHERSSAWSKEQAAKKHDGGWVEPQRYHSGGWPALGSDEQMIIAQSGERMLSRPEVKRMGGPAGVEAAARGGGSRGLTVNISAMDTQSVMEGFQDKSGRGLFNALRSGRGVLNRALGGG